MRPASKSIKYFDKRMGNYFNLHPNQMGTFTEINEISKIIKASNKGIMIGDSSLILVQLVPFGNNLQLEMKPHG